MSIASAETEPANRSVSIRMRNGAPAQGARMTAKMMPSRNAPGEIFETGEQVHGPGLDYIGQPDQS